MSTQFIAVIFLIVSYVGFSVQLASLIRLVLHPPVYTRVNRLVHRGLVRTAGCRVAAAVLYIFIGTNALFFTVAVPVATLGTFCAVQVLWMANSLIDVHLKRTIARLNGEASLWQKD